MTSTTRSTQKPVLFVLTSHNALGTTGEESGFYLPELTHPLHVLELAGVPCELASIEGGLPPVYGVDLTDPANAHYWPDAAFQDKLHHTLALADAHAGDYSAVMYVGGHGTMWDFPDSLAVKSLTRELYESDKIVAAVCHGPSALVNVKLSDGSWLVAGKHVAAFTDSEERAINMADVVPFLLETTLKSHGALHQAAPDWHENVVVDGNLITGQNPQSAAGVGKAILAALQAK